MKARSKTYEKQTSLLLNVLREIPDDSIALKGGTAINFFYRDAPRLSVDIDLTFLPILPREDSYKAINGYLKKCKNHLESLNWRIQVNRKLEGITKEIKNAFIFYLLSSRKPYFESLDNREHDISSDFFEQFSGMTSREMMLDELSGVFRNLKNAVKQSIEADDLKFLKSTLDLQPNWNLVAIKELENFPSVKWRMLNVKKMTARKRRIEIEKLEKWFG